MQQPSASGRTMNGLGPGMMMMHGRQDAVAVAQMRDIHALFGNHDRMTIWWLVRNTTTGVGGTVAQGDAQRH